MRPACALSDIRRPARGVALLGLLLAACSPPAEEAAPVAPVDSLTVVPDVEQHLAQYAPTELSADLGALDEDERQVVAELIRASRQIDEIFLRQAWTGNPALRERLAAWEDPLAGPTREYFEINYGPWDRLAEMEPFIGDRPHPPGAGYYPEDLTVEEMEAWLAEHPESRDAMTSLHTVVRRRDGRLVAVPYSLEYRPWLESAAESLRRAAARTDNASLAEFLRLRADAFASDDYYSSDLAWMELDSPVEVTIGPYETYEDGLFGYKAAFESFVTLALPEESAALARYKERLPWLERNLPIAEEDKNLDRGTESPIRVVDLVYSAGDGRVGVQAIAFNLPNDERVREARGSKKVLLRNIMRAKFERILVPIAERVLAPGEAGKVSFDAFFNEVLHHELSHGLGPGQITVEGRETEVRLELRDLYTTLEEAKADVMGVYNIFALIEEGEMPEALRETLEATYVAGLFRSARFGVHEAHGRGVISQFNYLAGRGALAVDEEGRYRTVPETFPDAIRELLAEILELQARGDYEGTASFLDRHGQPRESLLRALERLEEVPVDIRPIYPRAAELVEAGYEAPSPS